MEIRTASELRQQSCRDCGGQLAAWSAADAQRQLEHLPGWELMADGTRIRKRWQWKNFLEGLEFFRQIAPVAESEEHHPDLHLENYRDCSVVLWTHTLGGLSTNDFILAARIDAVAGAFAGKR